MFLCAHVALHALKIWSVKYRLVQFSAQFQWFSSCARPNQSANKKCQCSCKNGGVPFLLLCRYVNSTCGSPPLSAPSPRGSSISPSPSSLHPDIYSSAGSYTAEELGSHRSNNLSVVHLVGKWCMWKCGGGALYSNITYAQSLTRRDFTHYCRQHCRHATFVFF